MAESHERRPDFQSLKGEIAKRYNIIIRNDDPVFAIVAINELWLERFLRQMEAAQEVAQDQMSALILQQREAGKLLAEQAIAGGANYVAGTARAAVDELRAAIAATVASELAALRQAIEDARRERRNAAAWGAFFAVTTIAAVALIGLAGFWFGVEPR